WSDVLTHSVRRRDRPLPKHPGPLIHHEGLPRGYSANGFGEPSHDLALHHGDPGGNLSTVSTDLHGEVFFLSGVDVVGEPDDLVRGEFVNGQQRRGADDDAVRLRFRCEHVAGFAVLGGPLDSQSLTLADGVSVRPFVGSENITVDVDDLPRLRTEPLPQETS